MSAQVFSGEGLVDLPQCLVAVAAGPQRPEIRVTSPSAPPHYPGRRVTMSGQPIAGVSVTASISEQ